VVAPDVAAEALAAVPVAVAPDAADLAALVVAAVPVFVVAAVVVVADRVVAAASFLRRSAPGPAPQHSLRRAPRRGPDPSELPTVSSRSGNVLLRSTLGFSLLHQKSKYEEHNCSE